MYERFTDRARKVMQLAAEEARRFNHEYIGTEHVLLGLVRENAGVAANVLKNLDIDLRAIRREVELIVQHGPGGEQVVMGRLPHTPRTKKVIEYAVLEAQRLRHNYVGTEHLLLGLIREDEGVAAQILMYLGLKLEDVREEVLNLLGRDPDEPLDKGTTDEPDVVKIEKNLRGVEGYPVSDFLDESEEAPASPTDDRRRELEHFLDRLNDWKQASVAEQDFDAAAQFREAAEALARVVSWYRENRERP